MSDTETKSDPKWFVGVVKDLGFPIAVAMALLFGFGFVAYWTANNVVVPLVESHKSFLEHEKDQMSEIKEAVKVQAETQRQHLDLLRQIRDDQRQGVWRDKPQGMFNKQPPNLALFF
jgi:hypothetical protein